MFSLRQGRLLSRDDARAAFFMIRDKLRPQCSLDKSQRHETYSIRVGLARSRIITAGIHTFAEAMLIPVLIRFSSAGLATPS